MTFWKLTDAGWQARFAADDGRIGYGGLVRRTKREQGTGTTPLGTYPLPWAFGNGPTERAAGGCATARCAAGDFWVQDNASAHYNRYRNQAAGRLPLVAADQRPEQLRAADRLRAAVPHLGRHRLQRRQVRHRGAGIFLHVNGAGATAGCVSAPGRFMDKLMRVLDPERVPVIAVGR